MTVDLVVKETGTVEEEFNSVEPVTEEPTRGPLLAIVIEALKEDNWKFDVDDERKLVRAGVQGKNSSFNMVFQAKEEHCRVLIYVLSAPKVPEAKRGEAAKFFCRANYGLELGNFEFDMRDGEIRYKTSIDVEGGQLTTKMVNSMISSGASTMDRYFPGVMRVCFGDVDAATAVDDVESNMRDELAQRNAAGGTDASNSGGGGPEVSEDEASSPIAE